MSYLKELIISRSIHFTQEGQFQWIKHAPFSLFRLPENAPFVLILTPWILSFLPPSLFPSCFWHGAEEGSSPVTFYLCIWIMARAWLNPNFPESGKLERSIENGDKFDAAERRLPIPRRPTCADTNGRLGKKKPKRGPRYTKKKCIKCKRNEKNVQIEN